MYCYIYDEFVQDKRFEKDLLNIENRVTDLGISGKVLRLALFRNAQDMIRDEVKRGISTVVVVGNDTTIRKVVDIVYESGITLAIIPLGDANDIAPMMGVPKGVAACDVLSARIVEEVNIGLVNDKRFITNLFFPGFTGEAFIDGNFRISPKSPQDLAIVNLGPVSPEKHTNPTDGALDVVLHAPAKGLFKKKNTGRSIIPAKNIDIRSEQQLAAYADGEEILANRFDITLEQMPLKIVTGKERTFSK